MMDLIQEYIACAKACALTDYADKKSVRLHNESVKRMYKIAEKIVSEQLPESIEAFVQLLYINDCNTNIWAAVHMLELIPVDKSTEEKALQIIKKQAAADGPDALGFKLWLDNYMEK
ncbi:MAG: hypothetical protein JNN28_07965 [Saprospiraceae bacterium]|nr:hypothetical protein [Saprospiraceae bacterium]